MSRSGIRTTHFFLTLSVVFASGCTAHAQDQIRSEDGKTTKVFILAGQSNMEGRADGNLLTPQDRERLANAQDRVQLAFNGGRAQVLNVVRPSAEIAEIYKREKIFGPELFLGITLAESWPKEKILLIKYTAGATSLHGAWNADWNREKAAAMGEENEPQLFAALLSYVEEVLSNYDNASYEIGAMLWVQGETDSGKAIAAAAYGDNLERLIRRVREDLGKDTLPFLLFQVGDGQVVEGMARVARTVPGVTLIPQSPDPASPDFYEKMDNGHYNHEGQKKLGVRFAEACLAHQAAQGDGGTSDAAVSP